MGRRAPAGNLHSPLCPLDAGSCNPGLERSSRGFSKRIHTLSQYAGWSGLFIYFFSFEERDIYSNMYIRIYILRTRWLDGITDLKDMSLSKLREMLKDREAWHATVPGVVKRWTQLSG